MGNGGPHYSPYSPQAQRLHLALAPSCPAGGTGEETSKEDLGHAYHLLFASSGSGACPGRMSYAGRSVSTESASGGCIYIRHPVFCFALTNFLKTFQIFLKLFCHMNCQLKRKLCSTLATKFTCIYANWNLLGEREGGRGLSEPERRLMRCGGSARRSVGRRGARRASPPTPAAGELAPHLRRRLFFAF